MEVGKILPVEAAAILHASPQFVRVAMQQEKLPIGTAIKMSSIWTYNISEKTIIERTAVKHGFRSSANKGVNGWWIFDGERLVIP